MSDPTPFCWNCRRVAGQAVLHRDGIGSRNWICWTCEDAIDAVIAEGKAEAFARPSYEDGDRDGGDDA